MAEARAESFTEALIGLGGNVGDAREAFDQAIAMLCDGGAVRLDARSSDYRTPPWGVTDQPPFVNAVIAVPPRSRRAICWRARSDRTRARPRPRAANAAGGRGDRSRPPRL
jgi:2-amino-4-hydroxy-6-hydroxymethyldihydropteridine diphosphokinase